MHPRRLSRIALVAAVVGLGLVFAAPAAPARPCDTNGELGDVDTPVAEVNRGTTGWQWQYVGVCTPAGQDVDVYLVDGEGNGTEPDGTPDAIVDTWSCGTASTAATGGCLNAAAGVQPGRVTASTGAATPSADVNVTPCAWAYVRDVSGTGACTPPAGANAGPDSLGGASAGACADTVCIRVNGDFCRSFATAAVDVENGDAKRLCVASGDEVVTLEVMPPSSRVVAGEDNDVEVGRSELRLCEWKPSSGYAYWMAIYCAGVSTPSLAADGVTYMPEGSPSWVNVNTGYWVVTCGGSARVGLSIGTGSCAGLGVGVDAAANPGSGWVNAQSEDGTCVSPDDPASESSTCYVLKAYFRNEPGGAATVEVSVCKETDAMSTGCYAEPAPVQTP